LRPTHATHLRHRVAELAIIVSFPIVVWGVDELARWVTRRRHPRRNAAAPDRTPAV
jgi:hypothetical protein